jgi:peptidoglycan hydrolase-like protein with peptidoglycan-binding domain
MAGVQYSSEDLVMRPMHSLLVAALAAAAMAAPMATASAADAPFVDSQTVRQVQKTLNDRGFRTGGVDGRMGPQTQAALVNFQRAEKLQPTGKLDGQTLAALGLQESGGALGYNPEIIRKVQETLNARGYKAGAPNGKLGETTRNALRAFQKSENIAASGRLNSRTLSALGIAEGAASAGSTAPASRDAIREVQRKLAERGYRPGSADGIMGRATRAALMEFQRKENLAVTGRADRRTLEALGV